MMMAEYTDLQCDSPDIAEAVLRYLNEQQDGQEEMPDITAYINKSTLRVTYGESENRREWDMQLMGFRDGLATTVPPAPADWMHEAAKRICGIMQIADDDIKDISIVIRRILRDCAPAIPPPSSDHEGRAREALRQILVESEFVGEAKAPFSTWVAEKCRAALSAPAAVGTEAQWKLLESDLDLKQQIWDLAISLGCGAGSPEIWEASLRTIKAFVSNLRPVPVGSDDNKEN